MIGNSSGNQLQLCLENQHRNSLFCLYNMEFDRKNLWFVYVYERLQRWSWLKTLPSQPYLCYPIWPMWAVFTYEWYIGAEDPRCNAVAMHVGYVECCTGAPVVPLNVLWCSTFLQVVSIALHVGSQLFEIKVYHDGHYWQCYVSMDMTWTLQYYSTVQY